MRLKYLLLFFLSTAGNVVFGQANGRNAEPRGTAAIFKALENAFAEKDLAKKTAALQHILSQYPGSDTNSVKIQYDKLRYSLATEWAAANKTKNALAMLNTLKSSYWQSAATIGVANGFLDNGKIALAEKLIKNALDTFDAASVFADTGRSRQQQAIKGKLNSFSLVYGKIMIKKGNYQQALQYISPVYEQHGSLYAEKATGPYVIALTGVGRKSEALALMTTVLLKGNATAEIKEATRKLYIEMYGGERYNNFIDSISRGMAHNVTEEMMAKMIKKEAPGFSLMDVNGKLVSLADYKGKTVMLDFWATWCGPCKKSFPAMQSAINKYKGDTAVVFLFIHTFEREPDSAQATTNAQKYITGNHYTFRVLMDLRHNNECKVAKAFGVNGIPAKFVIDKNGFTRFSVVGLNPAEDAAVEEIIAMIELTKKA